MVRRTVLRHGDIPGTKVTVQYPQPHSVTPLWPCRLSIAALRPREVDLVDSVLKSLTPSQLGALHEGCPHQVKEVLNLCSKLGVEVLP